MEYPGFFTEHGWVVISSLGFIITLLLSAVAWFIARNIKQQDQHTKDSAHREEGYQSAIGEVSNSVQRIDKASVRLEATVNAQQEICKTQHKILNSFVKETKQKLDEHDEELISLGKRLSKLNNL